MKKLLSTTALLSLLGGSAAYAADTTSPVYLRLDTGGSFSTNVGGNLGNVDAGSSAIIGAGLGYRFSPNIRADVTLGYRPGYQVKDNVSVSGVPVKGSGDVDSFDAMANVYYDIGTYGVFTPYVGAGLGLASNTTGTTEGTIAGIPVTVSGNTQTSFAWQLGLGTAVDLSSGWALDVGYRYFNAGNFKTGTTVTGPGGSATIAGLSGTLHANELQVGLRYSF